ncbi:hypothetical protein AX15_004033 [Amanita polypyramis BW_CC]|nr:hypothetical protein AX15_004033 [Amanita polypyramis BW_CC]
MPRTSSPSLTPPANQRLPPSGVPASPVTPARLDAARSCLVRCPPSFSLFLLPSAHHPQSCLKRGLGATCAYPDPDAQDHQSHHTPAAVQAFAPPPMYATLQGPPNLSHQHYYDYNGTFTGASTSTFRPNKRPRNLTEEEAAAITRNFSRGDFYVGNSAPVRIDPRLPVRLTLGEGDHVHFTVGEALV